MWIRDLPAENAIKVGNLFLLPRNIESFVSNSVRLLTFEHNGVVGFGGSCTLFKFRGRKFVATTRHQLGIKTGQALLVDDLDAVRVTADNNGMLANILVDRCIFEKANPDQEYHDLVILQVAPDAIQTVAEQNSFLPVLEIKNCHYFSSFCVGYPTFANSMDYEKNHLKIVSSVQSCRRDQKFSSYSDYVLRFLSDDSNFGFDGFSGGAVFSLLKTSDGYEIALDAIILRAGHGKIYAVSSDFLRTIC